jgi:hypothetical protein
VIFLFNVFLNASQQVKHIFLSLHMHQNISNVRIGKFLLLGFPFHQTCLQAENDQSKQWQRRLQWTVRSNGDILTMLAGGRYHIYFHYFCIT